MFINFPLSEDKDKIVYNTENIYSPSIENDKRKKYKIISEKHFIINPKNKELILETFDNSQCKNKEDWELWFIYIFVVILII